MNSDIEDAAESVFDELGEGWSESVYHRSLEAELSDRGVSFSSECSIPIFYKGHPVGRRRPDMIVEEDGETIVVELKAGQSSGEEQLLQYLELLGEDDNFDIDRGVLINFGDDLEIHENKT